jgi:hypothetical protein
VDNETCGESGQFLTGLGEGGKKEKIRGREIGIKIKIMTW